MTKTILAAALLAFSASSALADPKVITVENCAKVEVTTKHNVTGTGDYILQVVKCSGDDTAQPTVTPPDITSSSSIGQILGRQHSDQLWDGNIITIPR